MKQKERLSRSRTDGVHVDEQLLPRMVPPFVTRSELIAILNRVYINIILQVQALSTHEHHCSIDDAQTVHRVFLPVRTSVLQSR